MGQELSWVSHLHHLMTALKLVLITIWGDEGDRYSENLGSSPKVKQQLNGQSHMFFLSSPCDWLQAGERSGPASGTERNLHGDFSLSV